MTGTAGQLNSALLTLAQLKKSTLSLTIPELWVLSNGSSSLALFFTPFYKFCVSGGAERRSLTLGVFEWLVSAPQIAQNVSRIFYIVPR